MDKIKLILEDITLTFKKIKLSIIESNIENSFTGNKKTLLYTLLKAENNSKNRLNKIALTHKIKYSEYLNLSLGDFILKLKIENNLDYKLYLNKYGDNIFCKYKINDFLNDKGIYCYIIDNEIKYIGRCRKTFKSRINNEYGKISAYNCLIDGQATNCHINSLVNSLESVYVGIYEMTDKYDQDIIKLEKYILSQKKFDWNIQSN